MRKPAISEQACVQFIETIDALSSIGPRAQEFYSSLFVELLQRIQEATISCPLGTSNDPERVLHTIYQFNENGIQGTYSCDGDFFVITSASPNREFYALVTQQEAKAA